MEDRFLLRYNQSSRDLIKPEKTAEITKTDKGYNINTGILQAFIPEDGSGILGPIIVNGKTVMNNSVLRVNEKFSSGNDKTVITIEESGPVRVVVCLKGTHKDQAGAKMLDYIVRWFFHAGSSRIDMEHIFLQRESVVKADIKHIDLVMDLPGAGISKVTPGSDPEMTYDLNAGDVIINSFLSREGDTLHAVYPYQITQAGRKLKEGFKYQGDFSIRGDGIALCGWMQDFWQKGPSQMSFRKNEFTLGLVGDPGTPFYMGMEKTSRITLSFTGEKDAIKAYIADPLIMAEPEWYSSTLATGHRFMPYSNGKYAAYDSSMEASLQRMINSTESSAGNYLGAGLLQYGDIVSNYGGEPGVGMNLETALDEGSLVQFLRTGDRKVLNYARIGIDHFIDIDIDHSRINGGLIRAHGQHKRVDTIRSRAGVNGHSWFSGVGQYEMFRASRRIYDIADSLGQYYTRNRFELEPYISGWRAIAWQFMALVQAFEITGKTKYLEAARQSLNVTNYQRDFMIEEWPPYMYAVGVRAVRQYYSSSKDNLARELYLQLVDGCLRLRSRPHDVVNGEWEKPQRTVLGNFPNDRSCIFYNEGAWAYLLSGDRRYIDDIAFDLNWQIALGVTDPTLICGSADLVKVMDEMGIEPLKSSVELPWAFMPPEQLLPGKEKQQGRAGVMTFQVNENKDREFTITLFKSSIFKYTVPYEGFATVYAPSGREVIKKPVSNKGINIYSFAVPADGETGKYILEIEFKNIWQWTMEETIIDLKKGTNVLLINPRFGHIGIDAVGLATLGYFPWIPEDSAHVKIFQLKDGQIPSGWQVFNHPGAYGQKYVRRIVNSSEKVKLPVEVAEDGSYRVYFRVWKPRADLVELQVEGQPEIQRIQQIHDMTTTEFPTWSLSTSLGSNSVVKYW